MTNCVYDAFTHYIQYLELANNRELTHFVYSYQKKLAQPLELPTHASIVPYLYERMLIVMQPQWGYAFMNLEINKTYVTAKSLFEHAPSFAAQRMMLETNCLRTDLVHRDSIDLEPAIYCMLNEQHALFSETVPSWKGARPFMAFQFAFTQPLPAEIIYDKVKGVIKQ